jgi:nitrogen-specific signal transduction histidine kinase
MSKPRGISEATLQKRLSPEEMAGLVKGGMKVIQMASIGRIISIIVHEINNPMQAIQGGSALALEELDDTEAVKTYLELIQRESGRVLKLTNLLRSIYGPNETNREDVFIKATIDEVLLLVKDDMRSKGINFELKVEEGLPSVKMSRHQVFVALLNLFLNLDEAISATGHKNLNLGVSRREDLIRLQFAVDFPIAIDPSGVQASPACLVDMSLADRLVEAYGGTITLALAGHYSHLLVEVPLQPKDAHS